MQYLLEPLHSLEEEDVVAEGLLHRVVHHRHERNDGVESDEHDNRHTLIPDLAEMVVKERIRQLESEAKKPNCCVLRAERGKREKAKVLRCLKRSGTNGTSRDGMPLPGESVDASTSRGAKHFSLFPFPLYPSEFQ